MVFAGNISQKKFKAQKVGPTKNKRKFGGGVGGVEKLHFPKFYVWKEKYEGCEKKPSAKIGQSKSCESIGPRLMLIGLGKFSLPTPHDSFSPPDFHFCP
jgi:hypothetical protein